MVIFNSAAILHIWTRYAVTKHMKARNGYGPSCDSCVWVT